MAAQQRIVPMLAYENAAAAIDWLCAAFGFAEDPDVRHTEDDGTVTHAEIEHEGARIMLATPNADYRSQVLEQGTLGDSGVFKDVVREADNASTLFFVNFDAGDWLAG